MGIDGINVRFFAYDYMTDQDHMGELDIVEIDESTFTRLTTTTKQAPISYERHTIHDNGCRQICLTVESTICGELI